MTTSTGPVRLYLSDLATLVALLHRRSESVTVTAGTAEAEDVEDLREATPAEIRGIMIKTTTPYIFVNFALGQVGADDADESSRDLADETVRSLRGYQAPWRHLMKPPNAIPFGLSVFLIVVSVALGQSSQWWVYPVFGILPLALVALTWDQVTPMIKVVPRGREESRRSWESMRQQLAIGLYGAVLGVVITYLVTKLTS